MQNKASNQKLNKILLFLIALTILIVIVTALRKNIHEVIPNQIYRSAQLSPSSLRLLVKVKKIHTVINLRGQNIDKSWYRKETNMSKILGLEHFDIALQSYKLPSKAELQQLTALILQAEKPILLHCESGSDRTGLASAIAMLVLENKPLGDAETAFSWRYFVTSNNTVGKQVFSLYQNWLQQNHLESNSKNFLTWVNTVYQG